MIVPSWEMEGGGWGELKEERFFWHLAHSTSLTVVEHMSCSPLCNMVGYVLLSFALGDKMLRCGARVRKWKQRREGKLAESHRKRERAKNRMMRCCCCFPPTDTRLCSSKPCAGNATCIETGEGGYLCICPHGYAGENCHLKRGACLTNRYQHL